MTPVRVDVVLTVGAVNETVTISETATPEVNTSTPEIRPHHSVSGDRCLATS